MKVTQIIRPLLLGTKEVCGLDNCRPTKSRETIKTVNTVYRDFRADKDHKVTVKNYAKYRGYTVEEVYELLGY